MKNQAVSNPFQRPLFASLMALVTTLMMGAQALAHPGHDHHANESMLMHVLFYGSIIAAIATCAGFAYGYVKKQGNK